MTISAETRGGAAVGIMTDFDEISATSVIYLRMWCDGPQARQCVQDDLFRSLGAQRANKAISSFSDLCSLCVAHGRRPLMRHAVNCKCVGADEACFATFVSSATEGVREDAMLIATLLVRPDVAPVLTALACDFGLALKQMNLAAPKHVSSGDSIPSTLH